MTKRYCTGFAGSRRVASGELREVALKLKELFDSDETEPLLVFDDETGSQIDLPLAGTVDELTKSVAVLSDGKDAQHGEKAAAPSGPIFTQETWMFWISGLSTSRETACISTASRKVGPGRDRPFK